MALRESSRSSRPKRTSPVHKPASRAGTTEGGHPPSRRSPAQASGGVFEHCVTAEANALRVAYAALGGEGAQRSHHHHHHHHHKHHHGPQSSPRSWSSSRSSDGAWNGDGTAAGARDPVDALAAHGRALLDRLRAAEKRKDYGDALESPEARDAAAARVAALADAVADLEGRAAPARSRGASEDAPNGLFGTFGDLLFCQADLAFDQASAPLPPSPPVDDDDGADCRWQSAAESAWKDLAPVSPAP